MKRYALGLKIVCSFLTLLYICEGWYLNCVGLGSLSFWSRVSHALVLNGTSLPSLSYFLHNDVVPIFLLLATFLVLSGKNKIAKVISIFAFSCAILAEIFIFILLFQFRFQYSGGSIALIRQVFFDTFFRHAPGATGLIKNDIIFWLLPLLVMLSFIIGSRSLNLERPKRATKAQPRVSY